MRIFLTGASGFIGSAIVQELIQAGHQVTGLVRSDASARALTEAGAEPLMGNLDDLNSLKRGAANADGVIHTAFIHDFSNYAAAAEKDKQAVNAFGAVLAGSNRPLIVTGGILGVQPGHGELITEDDASAFAARSSESTTLALTESGISTAVIRLSPSVHGPGDLHGFVPTLIRIAREKGVSAYIGEGTNRWPAIHRLDAARLYRLALERGTAGSRYNGIADEGISVRQIAEVIGNHLAIPVVSVSPDEATSHFGWMSNFAKFNSPASNQKTRKQLGWEPANPGLLADLDAGFYFEQ